MMIKRRFNQRCFWIGSAFTIIITLLLYLTDDKPVRTEQANAQKLYPRSIYLPAKK
jgi:hypothetical protein